QLPRLADDLPRELAGLVVVRRRGRDLGLREAAGGGLERLLLVGEGEVHSSAPPRRVGQGDPESVFRRNDGDLETRRYAGARRRQHGGGARGALRRGFGSGVAPAGLARRW